MKNLEYNDTFLFVKAYAQKGVTIKEALIEAHALLNTHDSLTEIDLEYFYKTNRSYTISIDADTDDKEITRILKDYDNYFKKCETMGDEGNRHLLMEKSASIYINCNKGNININ